MRSTSFACIAWGATPCSSARVPRSPTTAAAWTAPRSSPGRSSPWTASSPAASRAVATAPSSASATPTVGSSSANTATSSPRSCPSSTVSGPTRSTTPRRTRPSLAPHHVQPRGVALPRLPHRGLPARPRRLGGRARAPGRRHLRPRPGHHRMALHPSRGARRPSRTQPEGHVRRHGGERRIIRRVRRVRRVEGSERVGGDASRWTPNPSTTSSAARAPTRRSPSSSRSGTFARAPRGTGFGRDTATIVPWWFLSSRIWAAGRRRAWTCITRRGRSRRR